MCGMGAAIENVSDLVTYSQTDHRHSRGQFRRRRGFPWIFWKYVNIKFVDFIRRLMMVALTLHLMTSMSS